MSEFYLKVAGVTFEGRQKVIARLKEGQTLRFEPDPSNPYDSSAVKIVTVDGTVIGFVGKDRNAQIFNNLMSHRGEYQVSVSNITGGGFGSNYGCNIKVIYTEGPLRKPSTNIGPPHTAVVARGKRNATIICQSKTNNEILCGNILVASGTHLINRGIVNGNVLLDNSYIENHGIINGNIVGNGFFVNYGVFEGGWTKGINTTLEVGSIVNGNKTNNTPPRPARQTDCDNEYYPEEVTLADYINDAFDGDWQMFEDNWPND